jgi:hypothetical protein
MSALKVDWASYRDGIDLVATATRLLGPAPGRRGERGRRHWWLCPFHEDKNASLCVTPGRAEWRCFGCGAHGDAIDLVRRLNPTWSFPEAVEYLTGRPAPAGKPARPTTSAMVQAPCVARAPDGPSGLPLADALALVEGAAARIWTAAGAAGLSYLRGRGLADETIRQHRLGWVTDAAIPKRDGSGCWRVSGVVVPWLDGDRLALVKIRRPAGREPRYVEVYRDGPALFPGPEAIRLGQALVVAEGEFDALLLGQELSGLATAVTLGGASARPEGAILNRMLGASPWFVATDADGAGDRSAAGWPPRARRVRPPGSKDWTASYQAGVDLRRWWVEEHFPADFDRLERASIHEYDAGMPREEAERRAGVAGHEQGPRDIREEESPPGPPPGGEEFEGGLHRMMPSKLHATLGRPGDALTAGGDRPHHRAPAGALTEEPNAALAVHDRTLVATLARADDPPDAAGPPVCEPTRPAGPDVWGPPPADRGWHWTLALWPIPWREKWGHRANELQDAGATRAEAEWRAFCETARDLAEAERRGEVPASAYPYPAEHDGLSDAEAVAAIDRAFAPVRVPFATGLELWQRRDKLTKKYGPDGTEPTETWETLAAVRDVRRGDRWLGTHSRDGEGPAGTSGRTTA